MMVQCNIATQIWEHIKEVLDDIAIEMEGGFRPQRDEDSFKSPSMAHGY